MQRKFQLIVIWGVLTALALAIGPADAQDAPPGPASTPSAPGATYDPACDVDHDGDVDIFDIQLAAGHWNQAGTWTGGDYWALSGNAGTTPGINVLGTTNSVTLTLVVSGTPALRIEPASDSYFGYSPNLIGGYRGNSVAVGIVGSTIGGGGSELMRCGPSLDLSCVNQAHGIFATVSGGLGSTASWSCLHRRRGHEQCCQRRQEHGGWRSRKHCKWLDCHCEWWIAK